MPSSHQKLETFLHTNETLLDSLNATLSKVREQLNTVDRLSLQAGRVLQQQSHSSVSDHPFWKGLRQNVREFHQLREELTFQQAQLENQIALIEHQQVQVEQQLTRLRQTRQKLGEMWVKAENTRRQEGL